MTETIVVCVGLYIAWRFLNAQEKPQGFVSQAAAAAAPVQAAPVIPFTPVASAVPGTLAVIRKKLAADEKLTPELKAAFDLIQTALEEK